jgi:hypothetical protein
MRFVVPAQAAKGERLALGIVLMAAHAGLAPRACATMPSKLAANGVHCADVPQRRGIGRGQQQEDFVIT